MKVERLVGNRISHFASFFKFYSMFILAILTVISPTHYNFLLILFVGFYSFYIFDDSRFKENPKRKISFLDRIRNLFKSFTMSSEEIVVYNVTPLRVFLTEDPKERCNSIDLEEIEDYKQRKSLVPGYTCFKFYSENNILIIQTKQKSKIKQILSVKILEDI